MIKNNVILTYILKVIWACVTKNLNIGAQIFYGQEVLHINNVAHEG